MGKMFRDIELEGPGPKDRRMGMVPCNWCKKKVQAFMAEYRTGAFYHDQCWKERQASVSAKSL